MILRRLDHLTCVCSSLCVHDEVLQRPDQLQQLPTMHGFSSSIMELHATFFY